MSGGIFFLFGMLIIVFSSAVAPINSSFTDSDSNTGNIIRSALLDISTTPASPTVLYNISNFLPGDTATRSIEIHNSGNVDLTYNISVTANPGNTILWTDTDKGLQIEIKDQDSGTVHYEGPISMLSVSDILLVAGQSHHLQFKLVFPEEADNSFQNLQESMTFRFDAMQLPGGERTNN